MDTVSNLSREAWVNAHASRDKLLTEPCIVHMIKPMEKAHLTSEHAQAASDKERQIVHAMATIFQQGVVGGHFRDIV